jgi:putative effector of murein hydrolase
MVWVLHIFGNGGSVVTTEHNNYSVPGQVILTFVDNKSVNIVVPLYHSGERQRQYMQPN